MTLADALGCASEALSASALTPETAQRVYDFLRRWGLIGWNGETKRGGGDDDDDPAMATRPTRPPSGTTEAAADALYRFAPAPANAAAAYAAAARDAASRAATNPYGVRDLNFVRLGRPPKNPAAIAAAAARDVAADAERYAGRRTTRLNARGPRAPRARGRGSTLLPLRQPAGGGDAHRDGTRTRVQLRVFLLGRAPGRHVLRVVRARGGCRRGGGGRGRGGG